jgi:DNA phosphorothioation-dependent restriction protein DptH
MRFHVPNTEVNNPGLKNYSQVLSVIDRLKNNQAEFVTGVPDKYGEGFIVNFGKDNLYRGLRKLDGDQEFGITEIIVPESDGYTVPLRSLVEVVEAVKNGSAGFDIDGILDSEPAGSDKPEPWLKMHIREKTAESIVNEPAQYADTLNDSEEKVAENTDVSATEVDGETSEHSEMIAEYEQNDKKKTFDGASDQANLDVEEKSTDHELSEVRLPLGYAEGSSQIINWEYGNSNLANRHMLVSGKSGQGKTYFLQGLILEMAKKHISTLVIDYTKSYALPQLDAEFKEKMAGKIKQEIVYQDGIALNPFKLGKVDLGLGEPITESPSDMIERVAQTFDFVFNLGIQQRSQLIDAIAEEYETYHEDLTFEQLGEHLKADKDAKTLYGRIRALLKPGIFNIKADPIDWDRVFNDEGKMTVIQLTGHQHDIQSAITEFVLWNLFQFSLNSSEKVAKPIFLDEIQNLDFGNESPTVKIIREGRKFGLSGIFATQSLSSVHGQGADSIWNAAVQIHFLPPEDQMQALSKAITSRPVERPDIESKIRALKKGHALLHGPILGEDGLVQTNEEISIIQMNDR